MAHYNTILNQITAFIPRHDFDYHASIHHVGQKFRSFSRWSQFMAMLIGQLTGRKSLRDITDNLKAQRNRLYHLGMKPTSRATLARVNEQQPASLYEALFTKLLAGCQRVAPSHKFSFSTKLYLLVPGDCVARNRGADFVEPLVPSLRAGTRNSTRLRAPSVAQACGLALPTCSRVSTANTTTIDLCLSVFPWAKFRSRKGAIRLHTGLDADGYLPAFMDMTDGKVHEINWAKKLKLPKGSFAVFDRGFTDYGWYSSLIEDGIFFVTRLKSNADVEYLLKRAGRKSQGVTNDQQIKLKGISESLRLVAYTDPETGNEYRFITNAHHLKAAEIASIY